MIKITKVIRTCWACPSQWELVDNEGYPYYIRFRYGFLSVRKGKKNKDILTAIEGKEVFSYNFGGVFSGYMEYEHLKEILKDVMIFPEKEYENYG